jgi:RHS repeat-associated protein
MKAIKRNILHWFSCLALLLLSFFVAQAGTIDGTNRMAPVAKNQVLSSNVAQAAPGTATDASVKDLITLGVDPKDRTYISTAMDVKVKLQIQLTTANGVVNHVQTLEIKINPFTGTAPYLDKASSLFSGGYACKITILDITVTTSAGVTKPNTLPSMIYLDNDVSVVRYFDFTAVSVQRIPMNANTLTDLDCDGINDEVQVSWPAVTGAEEYQLEWTYVNDYGITPGIFLQTNAIPYDFKNNSTRITTTNTSYGITLAFEHGYLLCRVRAIGRSTTSPYPPVTGVWSLADAGLVSSLPANNILAVTEHEGNKNWQFSSTYAEEGKKKEVISYFDGSLRNRQTVTKMNSGLHHNTIVGETIYDFQGRPAVNVLPAPVMPSNCTASKNETAIRYYPNFNIDTTSTPGAPVKYSRGDFDLDGTDSCHMHTAGMDPSNGASNYYSQQNPDKTGAQAFLPDAQKRPFTQVEYTPDNTGRIRRQGGVGPDHQLNSDHETIYIYGNPDQILVDRLFGSEAGDAAHYKINTVIDANGQASNSYLDQEGRTIATSLAGNSHFDATTHTYVLDTIPGYKNGQKTIVSDLFASDANNHSNLNVLNNTGDGMVFSKQIAVSFGSDYTFDYGFLVDTLNLHCNTICMSCVYDLSIEVRNDCGQLISAYPASNPNPFAEHVGHFTGYPNKDSIVAFISSCNPQSDTTMNAEHIKVHLDPGNYTVNKVLKVNKAARDFYVAQYLKTADSTSVSCRKTLSTFVAASMAALDTSGCALTCKTCALKLGTKESFVAQGRGTDIQYDFLMEQCQAPCKTVSMCDMQYQMMQADVSPGGQYAEYLDDITHKVNPSKFALSVLNELNQLPKNEAIAATSGKIFNWRKPDIDINGVSHNAYIDNQGNSATIRLSLDAAGAYTPAVLATASVLQDANGYYTSPQSLLNVQDFILAWQPSWAKSLIKYHPEYCYYAACQKLGQVQSGDKITSDDFDAMMEQDTTFAQAVADKLINSNYLSNVFPTQCLPDYFTKGPLSPYDPFVTATGAGSFQALNPAVNIHNLLQDRFLHYLTVNGQTKSMVEVAAVTARCGTQYGSNSFSSGGSPSVCEKFGHDYTTGQAANDAMRNREWSLFVGFYRAEKQKIVKQLEDAYSKGCMGYNGCIGNSAFDPQAAGFLPPSTMYSNPAQPCSQYTAALYIHKIKRFIDQNDVPNASLNDVAYQTYLQTGQCPMAIQFQGLLSALARNQVLSSASVVSLAGYPELTADLYNFLNNNASIGATTPFGWQATGSAGATLTGNFINMRTNQAVCSVGLDRTGTTFSSWNDITGFQNLQPNGGGTGAYIFKAVVSANGTVNNAPGIVYQNISGSSCFKLDGCGFTEECKPNQLAIDLSSLMNVLAQNNKLTGTNVSLAASPYILFITSTIQNALGTASSALTWNASGNTFSLSAPANAGSVTSLSMRFEQYTPSSFTAASLGSIKSFAGMNSNYTNQFTVNGLDASGVQIVSIGGDVNSIMTRSGVASLPLPVSMGTCGLPTPLNCQGDGYVITKDLQALLTDELLKRPFNPNINVYTSPAITPMLRSYLPANDNVSKGYLQSIQRADTLTETLTLHFYPDSTTSQIILHHSNKQNPGYQNAAFSNLRGLSNLTGIQPQDGSGNYNGFYLLASYIVPDLNGNGYQRETRDTLFGISSLPVLNCSACPQDTFVAPFTMPIPRASSDAAYLAALDSTRLASGAGKIDSNQLIYKQYTTRLAAVNTRMRWQPTDTAYVAPIDYLSFYTGNFAHTASADSLYYTYYDTLLDSKASLRSLSRFVQTNGNHHSPSRLYQRYATAVTQYNQRAITFPGAIQLNILADSTFFDSLLVDGINLYISYLRPFPLAGQNPMSELAFRARQGTIPPANDSCVILYRQYLVAYRGFVQRQQTHLTCESYTRISPLFSYGDFLDNNFCCSSGYTMFHSYIAEFTNPQSCPGPLPKALTCSTPEHDIKECQRLYQLYLDYIRLYNGSAFAAANHHQLNNQLFISFDQFHSAGFCPCISSYLEYLSPYINAPGSATMQLPTSIFQFPGCTRTIPNYNCELAYIQLNYSIRSFNTSAYALAHHDSLQVFKDEKAFFAAGYCNCVENYQNYLNGFIYAAASANMGNPVSLVAYTGCPGTVVPADPCGDSYEKYLYAIAQYNNTVTNPALPPITIIYTKQAFIDKGYCYCLAQYIAGLQAMENGSSAAVQSRERINSGDIALTCISHRPPCSPQIPPVQVPSPTYTKHDNPCGKQQLNMAIQNAQYAYNQYIDSLKNDLATRYTSHCLGLKETFTDTYDDKEYHFTLYYYDQAGNLIRTIPPEGVSLLDVRKSSDPVEQQIILDRTLGSHTVFTNHTMATTYEYNSLNQLVKQSVPDHDKMNIFEYSLPNGLPNNLVTTSTQFVTASKGYLTGYLPGQPTRGYLFSSNDGGNTWLRLYDLVAANLAKVQMQGTNGVAVGRNGVVLLSRDAGQSWDLFPTYNLAGSDTAIADANLNDVSLVNSSNGFNGIVVGSAGAILQVSGIGTNALSYKLPTGYTPVHSETFTSVLFDNNVFYASGYDAAGMGFIYRSDANGNNFTRLQNYTATDLAKVMYIRGGGATIPTDSTRGLPGETGFAAGLDGSLLKTVNGGQVWMQVQTGEVRNFRDIYFRNTSCGVAIIDSLNTPGYGLLYMTMDGGHSWKRLGKHNEFYNSLCFYNRDNGVAVGKAGLVKRILTNAKTTPPYIQSPYFAILSVASPAGSNTNDFSTISAVEVPAASPTSVYAITAGTQSNIYYTTDLGASAVSWTDATAGLGAPNPIVAANLPFKNVVMQVTGLPLANPTNYLIRAAFLTTGSQNLFAYTQNITGSNVTATISRPAYPVTSPNFNGLVSDNTGTVIYTEGDFHFAQNKLIYRINLSTTNIASVTVSSGSGLFSMTAPVALAVLNQSGAQKITVVGGGGVIVSSAASISATNNATFTIQTQNMQPLAIYDLELSGNTLYTAGADGSMLLRAPNGTDFSWIKTGNADKLNAISFVAGSNSALGLVAADKGFLYKQSISGNTAVFTALPTNTTSNLNDIVTTGTTAYVAGDAGTVLLVTGISAAGTPVAAALHVNTTTTAFSGLAAYQNGGTAGVLVVGSNSAVYNFIGNTNAKVRDIFTPALQDAHFLNINEGFVIGAKGTIRHTSDAGMSWSVVAPQIYYQTTGNVLAIPAYNTVWTIAPGRVLIGGSGNYLAQTNTPGSIRAVQGPGTTTYDYLGNAAPNQNWNDIAFGPVFSSGGFTVGDNKLFLTLQNTGGIVKVLSKQTAADGTAGTGNFHALHIFNDNTFLAVGTNNLVDFYTGSGAVFNSQTKGLTGTNVFNAVYFHDDRNGYIAGNKGAFYSCAATCNIKLQASNTITWNQKSVADGFNIISPANTAAVTVNVLVFPSRYHGFIAGDYSGNQKNTIIQNNRYPYARLLHDESGLFSTFFWYDRLGRLIVSQNTKQFNKRAPTIAYSYTLYDYLGRIIEVGEKAENASNLGISFANIFGETVNGFYNPRVISDQNFHDWLMAPASNNGGSRTEVTHTYYDNTAINNLPLVQQNLRKRVATVTYEDKDDGDPQTYQYASHYSYDIHGNVNVLLQDNQQVLNTFTSGIATQRFKQVNYDYDLISGKVNMVSYQQGAADQFYHKYSYDADNRITAVFTSHDGVIWDNDANYFYYAHGPLARTEIGQNQVQGMDYAYTLQGWIKGVNSNALSTNLDMGLDGDPAVTVPANTHTDFARDAFGYTLTYNSKDYAAIDPTKWGNTAKRFEADKTGSDVMKNRYDLYNGNIGMMATTITQPVVYTASANIQPSILPLASAYRYDQLNRLEESRSFQNASPLASNNEWDQTANAYNGLYNNRFSYDANGNILTQTKNDSLGKRYDSLRYQYKTEASCDPLTGNTVFRKTQNRLYNVHDADPKAYVKFDIDDEGTFTAAPDQINIQNNYSYDEIGNLVKDNAEEIQQITWTVYGKIKEVIRPLGSLRNNLKFDYDPSGNRIAKHVFGSNGAWKNSTYYVRDAQGNTMATYKHSSDPNNGVTYKVIEHDIYGSSRLGLDLSTHDLVGRRRPPGSVFDTINHYQGNKNYEFSNHLGNVLAVITDKKIPRNDHGGLLTEYYQADLVSSTDYYGFGQEVPGRHFSSPIYRYGFNGKEKDDEVEGEGDSYDYGFRIYDPRLGRFLSIDPLSKTYPWYSPYLFAGNKPIVNIDLNGLEDQQATAPAPTEQRQSMIKKPDATLILDQAAFVRYENMCKAIEKIYKEVILPSEIKEPNRGYIEDQIRKKVYFDKNGNPHVINNEDINGLSKEEASKLREKAADLLKEEAIDYLKDKAEEKLLTMAGVTAVTASKIVSVVGYVFTPVEMKDGMPPGEVEELAKKAKAAAAANKLANEINDAIDAALGIKHEEINLKPKINIAKKDQIEKQTPKKK